MPAASFGSQSGTSTRRSGFTRPFHKQQMLSWLGYFIQIVMYFTIIFPCLTNTERIGITIPFVLFWIIYNACFIRATLETHTEPIPDPHNPNDGFMCRYCNKNIKNGRTKHCHQCNLCRIDFDHHCFFLNNCVTHDNYIYFLLGIIFLGINSIFSTLLSVYVIMNEEFDGFALAQASYFYGSVCSKPVFYTFHSLLMLMHLGIEVFMIYLYALHTVLFERNCTTFELIVYRRNQESEKRIKQMTLSRQ